MRKILLVIDDYTEMVALESFFRRLGFDVMSLGKDVLVNDAVTRFHPDFVLATAKGKSVDGIKLAVRVKRLHPAPRTALAVPPGGSKLVLTGEQQSATDAIIEIPFDPIKILKTVSTLLGLDGVSLTEKFRKQRMSPGAKEEQVIFVGFDKTSPAATAPQSTPDELGIEPGTAATAKTERSGRYDRFLADHDDPEALGIMDHAKAAKAMAALKKASEPERPTLDEIDRQKREFAKSLFTETAKKK